MSIEELKAQVRKCVLATTRAASDAELPLGLTTAQASAVLNRSKKTLHNWSSQGRGIRPVKDGNGQLLWPVQAVEAFYVREAK